MDQMLKKKYWATNMSGQVFNFPNQYILKSAQQSPSFHKLLLCTQKGEMYNFGMKTNPFN